MQNVSKTKHWIPAGAHNVAKTAHSTQHGCQRYLYNRSVNWFGRSDYEKNGHIFTISGLAVARMAAKSKSPTTKKSAF